MSILSSIGNLAFRWTTHRVKSLVSYSSRNHSFLCRKIYPIVIHPSCKLTIDINDPNIVKFLGYKELFVIEHQNKYFLRDLHDGYEILDITTEKETTVLNDNDPEVKHSALTHIMR